MHELREQLRDTGAAPLVDRVRRTKGLAELARRISGDGRVEITGLKGSSPAFVVAALQRELGRRIVVCVPDQEQAEDMVSDLATISSMSSLHFPEKEMFPQRFDANERATLRGARNRCLDWIRQGKVDVVVTSVLGFIEKTIPVHAIERSRRVVGKGAAVDLDELREHVVSIGYENTAIVEEAGQFAVRGGLFDIFDPSWDTPARVEFEDDVVVSIRKFDLDSQRSLEPLESLTILPATGVLVTEHSFREIGRALRDKGLPAEAVKSVLGELEHNPYSGLLRRYGPAAGMNGSLLDYFTEPPVIIFPDGEAVREAFGKLEEQMEYVAAHPLDEFPFLDLFSYVHPVDHYERFGCPAVWMQPIPDDATHRRAVHGEDGAEPERAGPPGASTPGDSAAEDLIRFHTEAHPAVLGKLDALARLLVKFKQRRLETFIYSESAAQCERLADLLEENEHLAHLPVGWLTSGFVWADAGMAVLTDHEIFHRILPRPARKSRKKRTIAPGHDQLRPADFVVHVDYGIGRFMGLQKIMAGGNETECLCIRYEGGDLIYVPVEQMYLVEKYVGKEGVAPAIDRLGSSRWQRTKEKTRRALEEAARELLGIYAERELAEGFTFSGDTPWQTALEASFPYEETPHQLQATEAIKRDMESGKPMDRLICGDVGYGKTEVAIRAAFKAVNDGKQVAVLVPTTILAMQHLQTFRERMEGYPVRVEALSRFKSPGEQKKLIEALRAGGVDIVIGTHRLLSADVGFRDLGLLIIDEEHRFGVKNKEKLKRLKAGVDVLTLTATPIPRTLYMALSGLRHVSLIETPPRNRHPVKTEIVPFDEDRIAAAIETEIGRGGQVFFVHNRVASIHSLKTFLERLLPRVRFGVAHGQMNERDLERVILAFLERRYDVLLSTMIIESGLDFPNVNTIIINRADRFGLAQLYQLRGRVGRRERQAYAYLFVPRHFSLSGSARKRLQAMEDFEELGSGYRLAMRDLEIRGAGNVLGLEQHGHLVAVGFDLYCKMLREAVEKLRGTVREEIPPCSVDSDLERFFPDEYIEDQDERMALYQRMGGFRLPAEVDSLESELIDRFGPLPAEADNLLDLTRIKLLGMAMGIGRVKLGKRETEIEFLPSRTFTRDQCTAIIETLPHDLLFKSGEHFRIVLRPSAGASMRESARNLLQIAYGCVIKTTYPQVNPD
jgi:transcription-repair coupling factor (superfamily II helicase)